MNKDTLISLVTERARSCHWYRPVSKIDVEAVITCLGDALLEDVLIKGERVSLPRLGQFSAKQAKNGQPFWTFDFSREAEAAVQMIGGEVAK